MKVNTKYPTQQPNKSQYAHSKIAAYDWWTKNNLL